MHKVLYNFKGEDVTLSLVSPEDALEIAMGIAKIDGVYNVTVDSNNGVFPFIVPGKARYEFHYVADADERGACWKYSEQRSIEETKRWAKVMHVITGYLIDRATGKQVAVF